MIMMFAARLLGVLAVSALCVLTPSAFVVKISSASNPMSRCRSVGMALRYWRNERVKVGSSDHCMLYRPWQAFTYCSDHEPASARRCCYTSVCSQISSAAPMRCSCS